VIFKAPRIHSVRKRFLWWPKRIALLEGEYRAEKGWSLQLFTPGFHSQGGYYSPPSTSKKRKGATAGGMVAMPVTWGREQIYDGWYWLEWVVEEYQDATDGPSSTRRPLRWHIVPPRKQWALFFEYF
jgi:hypothetical protein